MSNPQGSPLGPPQGMPSPNQGPTTVGVDILATSNRNRRVVAGVVLGAATFVGGAALVDAFSSGTGNDQPKAIEDNAPDVATDSLIAEYCDNLTVTNAIDYYSSDDKLAQNASGPEYPEYLEGIKGEIAARSSMSALQALYHRIGLAPESTLGENPFNLTEQEVIDNNNIHEGLVEDVCNELESVTAAEQQVLPVGRVVYILAIDGDREIGYVKHTITAEDKFTNMTVIKQGGDSFLDVFFIKELGLWVHTRAAANIPEFKDVELDLDADEEVAPESSTSSTSSTSSPTSSIPTAPAGGGTTGGGTTPDGGSGTPTGGETTGGGTTGGGTTGGGTTGGGTTGGGTPGGGTPGGGTPNTTIPAPNTTLPPPSTTDVPNTTIPAPNTTLPPPSTTDVPNTTIPAPNTTLPPPSTTDVPDTTLPPPTTPKTELKGEEPGPDCANPFDLSCN